MLEPITRHMTDESAEGIYSFTFYCDLCGKTWSSEPVRVAHPPGKDSERETKEEHNAAYERANLEAMRHFNRCPVCKRWVCDECFRIESKGDFCKDCAVKKK